MFLPDDEAELAKLVLWTNLPKDEAHGRHSSRWLFEILAPGKRADIVIRSNRFAEMAPGVDAAHQLVAVARGESADTVVVNCKIVFRGGRPTNVDEGAVIDGVRKSVAGMAKRLGIFPAGLWSKMN